MAIDRWIGRESEYIRTKTIGPRHLVEPMPTIMKYALLVFRIEGKGIHAREQQKANSGSIISLQAARPSPGRCGSLGAVASQGAEGSAGERAKSLSGRGESWRPSADLMALLVV